MREVAASPAGLLRVHALPGFVLGHLARAAAASSRTRYPQIVLDLYRQRCGDRPGEGGLRLSRCRSFPPRSEELVSRKLFPVRRVFCASPDYLQRHGTPQQPRDLIGHRLGWYSGYPTRERWCSTGATATSRSRST